MVRMQRVDASTGAYQSDIPASLQASAFPWRSLDTVRRSDLAQLSLLRRAVPRGLAPRGLQEALTSLVGPCELSIRVRRVTTSPPRVDASTVGILFTPADRPDRTRVLAVVLEQALAASLAGRALRRSAPRVVDPAAKPSASLAGASAALLVAAARRRALAPLRVSSAGGGHDALGEIVALDPNPLGVTLTVLLDHDAYVAHVFVPHGVVSPVVEELDAARLATLGDLPIEVPLVGAVLRMSVAELAALMPGDALFPVESTRFELAAPSSDVAFGVEVAADGRLVLAEGPHPLAEEEFVDKEALAQSIGEAPVVVRVEVGSAQMTAREWAQLGVGDVLTLGKRIGEHVTLRVAGVEVARGELVDVRREIGVRIIARSGETVA